MEKEVFNIEPFTMEMSSCASKEEMNSNVQASIDRGYTRINEFLGTFSGELAICGSAPSIRDTFPDIKGDILAINSAIRFLIENDIPPRFAMIWDASPLCEHFAVPHPATTYLIGARCHPAVFEKLKDCKVIVWHAGGDHNISDFLAQRKIEEPLINGGSAGVTRALYLGCALGYRKFNLYGADSSYSDEGDTHVMGSLVPEKDFRVWVTYNNEAIPFRTTPEMVAQVEEYMKIATHFNDSGMPTKVFGNGLLLHIDKLLQRKKLDDANLIL